MLRDYARNGIFFSGSLDKVFEIVRGIVNNSLFLNDRILVEPVGIPQLYDEEYLLKIYNERSYMG